MIGILVFDVVRTGTVGLGIRIVLLGIGELIIWLRTSPWIDQRITVYIPQFELVFIFQLNIVLRRTFHRLPKGQVALPPHFYEPRHPSGFDRGTGFENRRVHPSDYPRCQSPGT